MCEETITYTEKNESIDILFEIYDESSFVFYLYVNDNLEFWRTGISIQDGNNWTHIYILEIDEMGSNYTITIDVMDEWLHSTIKVINIIYIETQNTPISMLFIISLLLIGFGYRKRRRFILKFC